MNTSVQFVNKLKKMNVKSGMVNIVCLIAMLIAIFMSDDGVIGDKMDGMGSIPYLNYIMLICFCFQFMREFLGDKNDNPVRINAGFHTVLKTGVLDLKKIFTYIYMRFLPYTVVTAVVAVVRGAVDHVTSSFIFAGCAFVIPAVFLFLFYSAYKYIAEHRRFGGVAIVTVPISFLISVLSIIGIVATYLFGSMVLSAVLDKVFDKSMSTDAVIIKCYSVYWLSVASSFAVLAAALLSCFQVIPKKINMLLIAIAVILMIANVVMGANCYVHTELDKITVSDFSGGSEYSFSDIDNIIVSGKEEIEIKAIMKDGRSATILDDMYMASDAYAAKYSDTYSFALDLLKEMKEADAIITVKDAHELRKDAKKKGVEDAMKAIEALAEN